MNLLAYTYDSGLPKVNRPAQKQEDTKPCSHRYCCTLKGKHEEESWAVSQNCGKCGSLVRSMLGVCACGYGRKGR